MGVVRNDGSGEQRCFPAIAMSSQPLSDLLLQRSRCCPLWPKHRTSFSPARAGDDVQKILLWGDGIWRAIDASMSSAHCETHRQALFGARVLLHTLQAPVTDSLVRSYGAMLHLDPKPACFALLDDIRCAAGLASSLGLAEGSISSVDELETAVDGCRGFLMSSENLSGSDISVAEQASSLYGYSRKVAVCSSDMWKICAIVLRSFLPIQASQERLCASLIHHLTVEFVVTGVYSSLVSEELSWVSTIETDPSGSRDKASRRSAAVNDGSDESVPRAPLPSTPKRPRVNSLCGFKFKKKIQSRTPSECVLLRQTVTSSGQQRRSRIGVAWMRELRQGNVATGPPIVPSLVHGLDRTAAALWVVAMLMLRREPRIRKAWLPHPAILRSELAALRDQWTKACGDSLNAMNVLLSGSERGRNVVAALIYSRQSTSGFSSSRGTIIMDWSTLLSLAKSLKGLTPTASFERVRHCCQERNLRIA